MVIIDFLKSLKTEILGFSPDDADKMNPPGTPRHDEERGASGALPTDHEVRSPDSLRDKH